MFQRVQESIPPHCSLVDELSELLKISNDSVYRRLRNETILSIDEVELFANSILFHSIPFQKRLYFVVVIRITSQRTRFSSTSNVYEQRIRFV